MKRIMPILSVLCLVAAWTAVGADEVDPFDLEGVELSAEEAGAVLGGRESWDALDGELDQRREIPIARSAPLNRRAFVTSPAGPRESIAEVGGTRKTHKGTDLRARQWEHVFAVKDGVIIDWDLDMEVGGWIKILNDDGTTSVYYHVYPFCERGPVKAGEWIAVVGIAGIMYDGGRKSTGPHIHYEEYVYHGYPDVYCSSEHLIEQYYPLYGFDVPERTANNTRQD